MVIDVTAVKEMMDVSTVKEMMDVSAVKEMMMSGVCVRVTKET